MMTFLMVPIIMACATGGTIGMIKAIEKFTSGQSSKNSHEQQKTTSAG